MDLEIAQLVKESWLNSLKESEFYAINEIKASETEGK